MQSGIFQQLEQSPGRLSEFDPAVLGATILTATHGKTSF
jgi:hypothetical protein